MATAPTDLLPARPGSFDVTLEMPEVTVEPDLRSTFAGWADEPQGPFDSVRRRAASTWSGTTRWIRRLVVAAMALAAVQLGAHLIVHVVGSVAGRLDHSPTLAAPAIPSTTSAPTTTDIPTTTVSPTTTTPEQRTSTDAGPATSVAIPDAWVTPAEVAQLRDGMTYQKIVAIVGSPGFRSNVDGRGDGVDYLENPVLNLQYQQTRSTSPWETWEWPKQDFSDQSLALWVTFRAGHAVEIDAE